MKLPENFRHPLILAAVSGILTAFSFSPWNILPLGFFCFLPLLYPFISDGEIPGKKKTLFMTGIFVLIVDLIAFHWIIHTMTVFGHLPIPAALIIFLIFALGSNSRYFLFLFLLRARVKAIQKGFSSRIFHPLIFIPAAWSLAEYFGWQLFPYFASNLVSSDSWFIQNADIWGIRGLSTITVFFQTGFLLILLEWLRLRETGSFRKNLLKRPLTQLVLGLFLAFHLYGFAAEKYWSARQESLPKLTVGIPQGNTPLAFQEIRTGSELRAKITEILNGIVEQSVAILSRPDKKVDLLIWPESSVPFISYTGQGEYREKINEIQKVQPVQILLNDVHEQYLDGKVRMFSNVWLLDKNGLALENYHKVFLLPFGEFLPMGDTFPSLYNVFPEVSDFTHGSRFVTMPGDRGNFLPLVCYEVIQPDFIWNFQRMTGNSARYLVNITNDAWFGESVEAGQHLQLAAMRSIEYRLPLIRATNSGITSWTDLTGKIRGPGGKFVKQNFLYEIPLPEAQGGLFRFLGNFPLLLFILIVAGWLVRDVIRRRRKSS